MQCSSKRAAKIDNYIGNNKEKRKEKNVTFLFVK